MIKAKNLPKRPPFIKKQLATQSARVISLNRGQPKEIVDNIRVEDESGPKNQVPFFHNRMAKGLIETFAIEDIEASPIGGAL
jgi:hypothetical protein